MYTDFPRLTALGVNISHTRHFSLEFSHIKNVFTIVVTIVQTRVWDAQPFRLFARNGLVYEADLELAVQIICCHLICDHCQVINITVNSYLVTVNIAVVMEF